MQAMQLAANSNGLYDVESRMLAYLKSEERGSGCHAENPESPSAKFPNHT